MTTYATIYPSKCPSIPIHPSIQRFVAATVGTEWLTSCYCLSFVCTLLRFALSHRYLAICMKRYKIYCHIWLDLACLCFPSLTYGHALWSHYHHPADIRHIDDDIFFYFSKWKKTIKTHTHTFHHGCCCWNGTHVFLLIFIRYFSIFCRSSWSQ